MADPLSITAGIAGLLGFALHGSKRIMEFIASIRDAPRDITALSVDLRALYQELASLAAMQEGFDRNPAMADFLCEPLENCVDVFTKFTLTLNQYVVTTKDGSRRVRTWKHVAWAFKDKEIQLFRNTLLAYKSSLSIAIGSMTLAATASIAEQTDRIDKRTEGIEDMLKDDLLGLKNKLQALDAERIELASLAGDKGSGYQGTDTGFALGRFLSYAGSLCNSPPCSPSGSPVIAPSDAVINAESCDPCSPIANASALDKLSGIEYALQDLQDIGNLYPVPHIAVVGDKSAGKTSLVASLTGIKFRRVETACTRCATEIRLRRNKTNNTKLWIQPDRHCADSERGALQEFDHEVEQATSDEISSWLCRVADGIFPRAPDYVHGASRGISFVTRHKIIIEKSGPDLPCLTLVDLPGLVRYPNHEQSAEDLLIIEELTDFYIKDPHTVIVAVVAANMDYMEAPILEKVVSIDPQGTRTIGILTKPDIAESCGYADRYIRLMTGQDSNPRLKLEFSWYAVLNPGPGCDPTVDEQRREEASFWRGKWLCLPAENRGVDALQKQLRRKLQETAMRSIDATETQMCAAETPAETQLEDVRTLANKPRKQLMEIRDFLFLSSMGLICYTCGQDQPFYNKDGDSPRNTSRRRWGQESSGYYTCNDCHESPGHRCGWAPMWPAV